MGTQRFLIVKIILIVFLTIKFGATSYAMKEANDTDQIKQWAQESFLSFEFKEVSDGKKEIFIILGSFTSGVHSTEIHVYNKVGDKWVNLLSRAMVMEQVVVKTEKDNVIFSGLSGRILLILPFSGVDS